MDARLYQAGMADGRYTQNDSAGASTRCGADADWVVLDGCTVHIGDMANTIGGDVALCLITVTTCFCLHYACYGILLAIRTFLVSLFFPEALSLTFVNGVNLHFQDFSIWHAFTTPQ